MKSVVAVSGTRPEFIKIAPVLRELDRRGMANELLETGQHDQLLDGLEEFFEISKASSLICAREGSGLSGLLSTLLVELDEAIAKIQPGLILVQGDTTSALAGAMAGFHRGLPIGHIEAGLRSGDLNVPFPEEANRRLISRIATLHFTPTEGATVNLVNEGVERSTIHEVGNTIVDATKFAMDRLPMEPQTENVAPYTVVTVHRRESWNRGITSALDAVEVLAAQDESHTYKFVLHANPALQLKVIDRLSRIANVELLAPLPYPEFLSLIRSASMILSDSGGIQEEAPTLGVPTVILRDITERPEAISVGACRLAGTDSTAIVEVVNQWKSEISSHEWIPARENPFGDGHSSTRIVDALVAFLSRAQ